MPPDYLNNIPISHAEPFWIVTLYEHDILNYTTTVKRHKSGNPEKPIFPMPGKPFSTGQPSGNLTYITTRTLYDKKHNPTAQINPLGHYTETIYSESDSVAKTVACPYCPALSETTTYHRDANDNTIAVYDDDSYADPQNLPTRTAYDGYDRAIIQVSESNLLTISRINPRGLVTASITAEGSITNNPQDEITSFTIERVLSATTYIHDSLGRQTATRTLFFRYTDTGEVEFLNPQTGEVLATAPDIYINPQTLQITNAPDDAWLTSVTLYSADSEVLEVWDGRLIGGVPRCTSHTYDEAGRRILTTDPAGNSTQIFYDKNSNPVKIVTTEVASDGSTTQTFTTYNFYNARDELVATSDNLGNTRRSYYDSRGLLRASSDANGSISGTISDLALQFWEPELMPLLDNPNLPVNQDGHRTFHIYDPLARRTATISFLKFPASSRADYILTSFSYNDAGLLTAQTDDNGNTTRFEYNARGWRTRITYPDSTSIILLYNRDGTLHQRIDANNTIITNYYDKEARVTERIIQNSSRLTADSQYLTTFETFTYTPLGQLKTAEDNDTRVEFRYDSFGNQWQETQTVGEARDDPSQSIPNAETRTITSRIDAFGFRHTLIYPDGTNVNYIPDILDRSSVVTFKLIPVSGPITPLSSTQQPRPLTDIAHYTYIGSGYRILKKRLNNGVYLTVSYDELGRPVSWHWRDKDGQTLLHFTYAYDREGNKWYEKREHDGMADVFNYDGVYRLTDVKYSVSNSDIGNWNNTSSIPFEQLVGTRTVEYNMDGVGNRTSVVDDGKVTTYATNSVNEYVYVDNQRLMYDRNGNMTSDGNLRMFYDHNNMLVEIRTEQYVFHQRFDAIGRRLMVRFSDGLTETRYFWHDGQQVIYEEVSGLTEPYKYVWGNGVDEALLRFGNGDIWYLDNQLGSVMALTNDAGQVIESYSYDVYGAVTVYDATGQRIDMTNYDNRYLFTGREYNWHTGLYHYRARTYHPVLGRFTSRDPNVKVSFVPQRNNPYNFADVCPATFVDPFGEQARKKIVYKGKYGVVYRRKGADYVLARMLGYKKRKVWSWERDGYREERIRWKFYAGPFRYVGCSPEQIREIRKALVMAIGAVCAAKFDLLVRKPQPQISPYAYCLVPSLANLPPQQRARFFKWFGTDADKHLQEIFRVISRTCARLQRGLTFECVEECGKYDARVWGLRVGSFWIVGPAILLCPSFFNATAVDQARMIVHEASHLFAETKDYGYFGPEEQTLAEEYGFSAERGVYRRGTERVELVRLTNPQRRRNADTYAGYVAESYLGGLE